MNLDTIITGDNAEVLATFPPDCIDLTVTSPPYDDMDLDFNPITKNGLREYKGYSWDFKALAEQLYRVTKPGGVVVWVVNDPTIDGSESLASSLQKIYFRRVGFNVHDTMIYEKAGMRYPDATRYNAVFEYMFVLSKGAPNRFNPIKDRENIYKGGKIARKRQVREPDGTMRENSAWRNDPNRRVGDIGARNNVWRIPTGGENANGGNGHPAPFPEALAADHILSWSNPGDIVLDPFAGSGTTLKKAKELGRRYIGIEISQDYVSKIIKKRLAATGVPLFV